MASMKHKVHEAIKHAPDCLIVKSKSDLNLSQSQSERKVRNRDGRERGERGEK